MAVKCDRLLSFDPEALKLNRYLLTAEGKLPHCISRGDLKRKMGPNITDF